jgi:ABC-2 type transport system permease protein
MKAWLWLRRLQVLTVKEVRQLFRDVALMAFIFGYALTGAIYVSGSGITVELSNATLLLQDADRSAASRELAYRFKPPHYRLGGSIEQPAQGLRRLDEGGAMMVLDIPSGFAQDLMRGQRPATVQLMVDTSNVTMGYLGSAYGERIVEGFSQAWVQRRLAERGIDPAALPRIDHAGRVWYNPTINGHWFNAISQWLVMLTVVAMLLPGAALVREKERGTIEQLLVSPLSPLQMMLAKTLAMTAVIVAGSAISVFGIMNAALSIPTRGSMPLLFALTTLYVFTTAGFGLALATFARNQAQVSMLVILLAAPMVMLSGTWTAPEAMPRWLQPLIQLSPLHHFIECAYGVLMRGAGMDLLWDSALAMTALGAGMFALGLWRFRRQFE